MEHRFSWLWVENQVTATIEEWESCISREPAARPRFSSREQAIREGEYDRALHVVESEAKQLRRRPGERAAVQQRIVAAFPRFASIALGLEDIAIHTLTESFLPIGTQFAQWARRFDSSLSMADTIQACRNAWTVCGIQPLLGDPMRLGPAIIGYSLLYPYSDNFLDNKSISSVQKISFSRRFRHRLCGFNISPRDRHEEKVWAMVRLIERQFPRDLYSQVYECLLAIHQAQEESLGQLRQSRSRRPFDLTRVSFAKGGTSVLADACLSHGYLNDLQARFAFNWGVLLQLGDDLQDVQDDLKNGSATLFSRAAEDGVPLDDLVRQLLVFRDRVADQLDELQDGDAALKRLLCDSWRSLILMAVARSHRFFSAGFLMELEPASPFRFSFQRDRHNRLTGRSGLYKVLFESFLSGDTDNSDLPDARSWLGNKLKHKEQASALLASSSA